MSYASEFLEYTLETTSFVLEKNWPDCPLRNNSITNLYKVLRPAIPIVEESDFDVIFGRASTDCASRSSFSFTVTIEFHPLMLDCFLSIYRRTYLCRNRLKKKTKR
ncbi:hypothetical protein PUN28_016711 [Cardiocondyla obscurior]|uniref:Uncharacterized protein n=1 Tax=Cardiocondyla obscurior TaxID=286306 RepID=A0AAW2EU81_9HYME